MFFGWLIIGSMGTFGQQKRTAGYKMIFLVVAAILSVILVALWWDYSTFIIVWFVGVLMIYTSSSLTVRSKLARPALTKVIATLFVAGLASVGYEAYVIFTLTHESFSLLFGLLISACVFLGILLLNR